MSDATDIALLFSRDPLKHTDQDIDAMIAKMRSARHLFNAPASKPAKEPKQKPGAIDLSALDI